MKRLILWLVVAVLAVAAPSLIPRMAPQAATQDDLRQQAPVPEVSAEVAYKSSSGRHKLQVSDPEVLDMLKARKVRIIGDYGSFSVVEVDSATAELVTKNRQGGLVDHNNLIMMNSGQIDTTSESGLKLQRAATGETRGRRLHLVQFPGPVKNEWYAKLLEMGVEIVTYIPHNAYLVYGDRPALRRIKNAARANGLLQWEAPYSESFKIDPDLGKQIKKRRASGKALEEDITAQDSKEPKDDTPETDLFAIQLYKSDENSETLAIIDALKLEPIKRQDEILVYVNVIVRVPKEALEEIAAQRDVVSISSYIIPVKRDERQNQIMAGNLVGILPSPTDYLAYLAGKGLTQAQFTASGFVVDVSDDGLENGTTNINHPNLRVGGTSVGASRVVYNRIESSGAPVTPGRTGFEGHGNLNTHVIGGFVSAGFLSGFPHADALGFRFGLGVAPFVRVGHSAIFNPSFTFPNFANLQSRAYADGARISSNSWGASVGGAYNLDAQAYDALVRDAQPATSVNPTAGNQEMVIVFAAGNNGSGANTVGSPATGKNVISVGAAETVHSHSLANGGDSALGNDGCGIGDTGADNPNDIIFFSSRGPTDDGRKGISIMAPGTHVTGGVAQAASPGVNGTALATFNANGVCALSLWDGSVGNPSNFFPLGQQWYTTSSGTSHSTPAVAGAAALVRQHFINTALAPPSPAMTKGILMNSARYMNGVGANDTLLSSNQGMGEVNLNSFFDIFATTNILRDQVGADTFTATGQSRSFTGNVVDITRPFRVTLAWTDPPGPTSGNAFINNLDLEVIVGGQTYKGNVFVGANSATGGVADIRNNVESVFVPAGVSGPFLVRVKATNIVGDGVPSSGGPLDQDFALIVPNGLEAPLPVLASAGATIVAESCSPNNGAIDPNETLTVSFCLQNVGTASTNNLVGTLQATGGVTSPSGPQNYGVVVAGGPPVCRNFTFTASGSCGGTLTATLQLQDGATNLGTVTYTFTLGVLVTAFTENFDGVTAPALPAGWVTSTIAGDGDCTAGGLLCTLGTNWTTVSSTSDTAPNSAFHNDPSCVTDNRLDTPALAISTATAQLTFRHSFNVEDTFDGTVLEVSSPNINAGAFTDITNAAVGGNFVTGGYTDTINTGATDFFNPLRGRMAWSGNSGGFITTTANLGPNVAGQTIKLRFRFASDCSVSGTGHNIDTIRITDGFTCCVGGPACTLTCPANITVSNDPNQCGAVVNYPPPTVVGPCGTVTCSPASGSFFPKGTTTVTCTGSGPTTCTFTVTVNDTQPPTITCPANVTAATTQNACITANCAVVSFTTTASDNCPGVTIACVPPSGSCFPVGATTVTCTSTDGSGNTATCSFTVTTFDVCLQDDSTPATKLLFNSQTGAYRFCCGGTLYTGTGVVARQGCIITLTDNTGPRRVTARVVKSNFTGAASLQTPPGTTKCTITDKDIRNNVCLCP